MADHPHANPMGTDACWVCTCAASSSLLNLAASAASAPTGRCFFSSCSSATRCAASEGRRTAGCRTTAGARGLVAARTTWGAADLAGVADTLLVLGTWRARGTLAAACTVLRVGDGTRNNVGCCTTSGRTKAGVLGNTLDARGGADTAAAVKAAKGWRVTGRSLGMLLGASRTCAAGGRTTLARSGGA